MFLTYCELKDKEVVNCRDGKRLGYICDLEIDVCTGRIIKLILPPFGSFFCFAKSKDRICIPWENIEKIGDDIILVKYNDIIEKKK
ncbi:MAG: YlmC/YmxH family sporulation protein [Clostridia bacterium]